MPNSNAVVKPEANSSSSSPTQRKPQQRRKVDKNALPPRSTHSMAGRSSTVSARAALEASEGARLAARLSKLNSSSSNSHDTDTSSNESTRSSSDSSSSSGGSSSPTLSVSARTSVPSSTAATPAMDATQRGSPPSGARTPIPPRAPPPSLQSPIARGLAGRQRAREDREDRESRQEIETPLARARRLVMELSVTFFNTGRRPDALRAEFEALALLLPGAKPAPEASYDEKEGCAEGAVIVVPACDSATVDEILDACGGHVASFWCKAKGKLFLQLSTTDDAEKKVALGIVLASGTVQGEYPRFREAKFDAPRKMRIKGLSPSTLESKIELDAFCRLLQPYCTKRILREGDSVYITFATDEYATRGMALLQKWPLSGGLIFVEKWQ